VTITASAVTQVDDDDADERALAEAARTSPDAFGVLYQRHVRRVYGFAYRRSGSREVAEEVTSATFERAWRAMPSFEWKGRGFSAWLFAIAARELAAWYRRNSRADQPRVQRALHLLALSTVPDSQDDALPAGPAQAAALRRALASIKPRYQEVVSLRHLVGLDPEEAAEAMGCSKAVLAVTLHRAMAALRKALTETEGGAP
jgi:RNA polymerase sigma-70 factor (ECF subfamily)